MTVSKRNAVTALGWSAVEQFFSQICKFGIGVVLARLLTPSEFGLIAMLAVFVGISSVFVNCGFGEALIQKVNATPTDEASVFYLNVLFGILVGAAMFFGAPTIAEFYNQPELVPVARISALTVIVSSLGIVQRMLLVKSVDFRTQLKISMIATPVSGVIAIALALKGFGVISLSLQSFAAAVVSTSLLWVWHGWRPRAAFSLSSLREMFPYGSRLFAAGLLNSVFVEIYSVVIGKLFPAEALGYYARARGLQQLPVDSLTAIVKRVSFPVFAAIQNDKVKLKEGVRKALMALAWVNFPLMVGMAVTARPMVLFLLTDKWLDCVPLLQLLCIGGALYPLSVIHLNALSAQGRSDLFLRIEIFKRLLLLGSVILTYRLGVEGLLMGGVGAAIGAHMLNGSYSVTLINYSWKEQFVDLAPYAAISVIMGGCVWIVGFLPIRGNFILLISQVFVGVLIYGFLTRAIKDPSYQEVANLLAKVIARRKAA